MAAITLEELGITLQPMPVGEDDHSPAYVVSSSHQLSMKKMFPIRLGPYTFINRSHLVAYVSLWMDGNFQEARTVATAKKRPNGDFTPVDDTWVDWATSIAYMVALESIDRLKDSLVGLDMPRIVASGKDSVWESGQDKAIAARASPPHAWGLDAWGKALTKLRQELMAEEKQASLPTDNELVSSFLSTPLDGSRTVRDKLSEIKVAGKSIWRDSDAIDQVLIAIRQLSRAGKLDTLVQWASEVQTKFLDPWQFISTLPSLEKIREMQKRTIAATQAFVRSITSVERCTHCGSQVVAKSEQTRSADEISTVYIECYSDKCATRRKNELGVEELVPRVYVYHPNAVQRLK
jgi:DNA-directed RNA polymerase subunit M/transcription elongation factor TFIIS